MRLALLWCRRSFGCDSETGCRFIERILTIVQTCRLKRRSPLSYLTLALHAQRNRLAAPSLLAQG